MPHPSAGHDMTLWFNYSKYKQINDNDTAVISPNTNHTFKYKFNTKHQGKYILELPPNMTQWGGILSKLVQDPKNT